VAHLRYLKEMGVPGFSRDASWRARASDAGAPAVSPEDTGTAAPTGLLPVIRADIGDCTRCKLHQGRTNIVFGVGSPEARLMFVGEGPGADEDEQGEPFVGRAGQLLTQIIKAMGFAREEVYIANVVKCRPPGNRNPEPDEIEQCSPFLHAQIAAIKPVVIVALGKFAAQTLLQTETPISRLRGHFHRMGEVEVMPTFHPSYLLRNPAAKREVWEDMKLVMKRLTESA
jgi:DNA polymerase